MFTELNEAMTLDQQEAQQPKVALAEDAQTLIEGVIDTDLELMDAIETVSELQEMVNFDSELEFIQFSGQLNESVEDDEDLEEIANEDSPEDQMESFFDADVKVAKPAKVEDPAEDKDTGELEELEESFVFDNLFNGD